MKGKQLTLIIVIVFFMASGAYSGNNIDQQTTKPMPEKKQTRAEKEKRVEDKILDKDVAAELEMLKLIDMLENIDLLDDMDVLDGGQSK